MILVVSAFFCWDCFGQTQSARDELLYPVNPPVAVFPGSSPPAVDRNARNPFAPLIKEHEEAIAKALAEGLGEDHPTVRTLRGKLSSLKRKSEQAQQNIESFILGQELLLETQIERANKIAMESAVAAFSKQQEIDKLRARIVELEAELKQANDK